MESRKILRNYYLIRVDRVDQSWVLIEEGFGSFGDDFTRNG